MPDQPQWYRRIPEIQRDLSAWSDPWVDRAAVERLFGVGRRRAQQILARAGGQRTGGAVLATPSQLAAYLKGQPEAGQRRERERLRRLAVRMRTWQRQPRRMVEAAPAVESMQLTDLPDGVTLGPGRVEVRFASLEEAAEKMLALAMVLANDPEGFERETRRSGAGRMGEGNQ